MMVYKKSLTLITSRTYIYEHKELKVYLEFLLLIIICFFISLREMIIVKNTF